MVWRTLALGCKVPSGSVIAKVKAVTPVPKGTKPIYRESSFIDRLRMKTFGGPGGSGYPKINGVGGQGGSVFVEAVENATFKKLVSTFPERRAKAGAGENSRPHVLLGKNGNDVTIEVPPGVTVFDDANREIADLVQPGDRILVAKGGRGGNPRNGFVGKKGKDAIIGLYLKLIADIGFVGYPNAGKSTLLRGLSRAKPKVADYPFTTIRPNVGIMEFPDFRQIALADLPGLIEGAHVNNGLGYNFLRHIERTSLLMFVIDVQGFRLNERAPFRSAFETVMSLNKELELYRSDLVHKPAVLVINKMDTEGAADKAHEFAENMASDEAFERLPEAVRPKTRMAFKETVHVVAKDMENVKILQDKLRIHLDELHEMQREQKDAERPVIELPRLTDQLV